VAENRPTYFCATPNGTLRGRRIHQTQAERPVRARRNSRWRWQTLTRGRLEYSRPRSKTRSSATRSSEIRRDVRRGDASRSSAKRVGPVRQAPRSHWCGLKGCPGGAANDEDSDDKSRKLTSQVDHLKQITTLAGAIQTTFRPLLRDCPSVEIRIRKRENLGAAVESSRSSPDFPSVGSASASGPQRLRKPLPMTVCLTWPRRCTKLHACGSAEVERGRPSASACRPLQGSVCRRLYFSALTVLKHRSTIRKEALPKYDRWHTNGSPGFQSWIAART